MEITIPIEFCEIKAINRLLQRLIVEAGGKAALPRIPCHQTTTL